MLHEHADGVNVPCCMSVPMVNQKLFIRLNWFSTMSESALHGCGFSHSYGLNLCESKQ